MVPSKLDKHTMAKNEYVKLRTIELYDSLPQTSLEERATYTDVRDEVFELNYNFFGYVASHTFINNNSVSYEDKFQSACLHWCEMWHWYKFAPKYRTDLSFAVFFKPRVAECIERELNEVKYSLRRAMCMKAGDQLGKHWAQVKYEDLANVNLPPEEMNSLKAMFGSMYVADLDTHSMFISSDSYEGDDSMYYSSKYDTLEEMLMHEMIREERILEDKDLLDLAIVLDVPFDELKKKLPQAIIKLHETLKYNLDIKEAYLD